MGVLSVARAPALEPGQIADFEAFAPPGAPAWTFAEVGLDVRAFLLQNGLGLEEAAPAVRDLQARCLPPLPLLQARPPGARDEG